MGRLLRLGVLGTLAVAAALAGCSGADERSAETGSEAVRVVVRDFKITAQKRVPAGVVDLAVENKGPVAHELIVVRGTRATLPFRTDGLTADEDALERRTAGAVEPFGPGESEDLTVRLRPGRYLLFCNTSGHLRGGMHTDLVVN